MADHTPGPWRVDGVEVLGADGTHVVWELGNRKEADATLIAAAPALLEAAKDAAREWRLHGQLTDSCRVLEAAIAKAEGR